MEKIISFAFLIAIYAGLAIAYPIIVIPTTLIILYLALSSNDDNTEQYVRFKEKREAEKLEIKKLYQITTVDYKEYIKSTAWYQKRLARLKKDKYTCQKCGDTEFLEVHHLTYDNLGDEPMEDLVCLCRDCHQAIHDKYGRKGNYFPID